MSGAAASSPWIHNPVSQPPRLLDVLEDGVTQASKVAVPKGGCRSEYTLLLGAFNPQVAVSRWPERGFLIASG